MMCYPKYNEVDRLDYMFIIRTSQKYRDETKTINIHVKTG